MFKMSIQVGLICCLLGLAGYSAFADGSTNAPVTVVFHGEELFRVAGISSVPAEKRSENLIRRLKILAKSPLVSTENFTLHHDDELKASLIMSGADVVSIVWEVDAALSGITREELAEKQHGIIKEIIEKYRKDHTRESYVKAGIFAVVATLVFLLISFVLRLICRKETAWVTKKFSGQQMLKFVDGNSLITINTYAVRFIRFVIMLWVFILYLNLVLSFFPWTFNLSAKLFDLISSPVILFGEAFVDNLPNLFALAIIIAIVWFVLRGLKNIFSQIGVGKVRIKGFYRDWADPTFRLVRIVIIVFAAVVAFPFIPGSNSPAFKGISIFMGVLVSLGSTSAVGNIVAGLVLTYMRPFVTDDFVEISGMRGTVESRGTFSTRLKTPTNEIISIPNASVSTNHIINFSRMAQRGGVNVGAVVTIGYDVPWRKVHELLLSAAKDVDDVLEAPPPKVLQLELGDFYVQYKLIITTKNPERRFAIRSKLYQNIQDCFAEAGVEIMSPHYQANRTGEDITIPAIDDDREVAG